MSIRYYESIRRATQADDWARKHASGWLSLEVAAAFDTRTFNYTNRLAVDTPEPD